MWTKFTFFLYLDNKKCSQLKILEYTTVIFFSSNKAMVIETNPEESNNELLSPTQGKQFGC